MNARIHRQTDGDGRLASLATEALSPARIEALAHVADWPEAGAGAEPCGSALAALLARGLGDIAGDMLSRESRQFRARLAERAFRLADGPGDPPRALGAVVEIVHAASLIVDDIEDGSIVRRGEACAHVRYGLPLALNAGNWMYFRALQLLQELEEEVPYARGRLQPIVVDSMARCHLGQALDLSVKIGRLPRAAVYPTVATTTMLKTGALMELAARLGARCAGAEAESEEQLAQFGRRLGLGLQMLDDLGNLTARASGGADKALEDLRNGTATWPWALAARALDEATFDELQAAARAAAGRRRFAGDGDGQRRALAAALRMAVGYTGRQQAARYLAAAHAELRAHFGDHRELNQIAAEIERLERSYG